MHFRTHGKEPAVFVSPFSSRANWGKSVMQVAASGRVPVGVPADERELVATLQELEEIRVRLCEKTVQNILINTQNRQVYSAPP